MMLLYVFEVLINNVSMSVRAYVQTSTKQIYPPFMTNSLLQNQNTGLDHKAETSSPHTDNEGYQHHIAVDAQNFAETPLQLQENQEANVQDMKINQGQTQTLLDDSNKENQSPLDNQSQGSDNNASYFLGDDDDQITDSDEEEIDSSDQQQEQQPKEESSSSEQQVEQSDEDLQDNDSQISQIRSDDEEQSEDEYPDDYDSDQPSSFDKLLKQAFDEPSIEQMQQQFLERYQKIKLALQIEQLHLKQEQAIYISFPVPMELQMRKMRLNQGILHFINNNYVRRLNFDQARRKRKIIEDKQSNACEAELNCDDQQQTQSMIEGEYDITSKRVVFLDSIQAKMYKNDQEVHLIQQTAQFKEAINNCERGSKRFITISLNNSPPKQNTSNRPRLPSCQDINTQSLSQNKNQKTSKQPQILASLAIDNAFSANYTVREQDLKSNDTNSSQQLCSKQQFQFWPAPTTKLTFLQHSICKTSELSQKKQHGQHSDNVYFCSDCIHSQTSQNGLEK